MRKSLQRVLAAAQAEATRIFRKAGIEVSWLPCAGSEEEFAKSPQKFTDCAQTIGAVIVRIQPTPLSGRDVRLHSKVAAAGEERVEVLYDRLKQFSADLHFRPESILAPVMAHELGHLLLGEQSHSSQGIMIPTFRPQELLRAQSGKLLFTLEQAQRMRDRQIRFNDSDSTRRAGMSIPDPWR